MQNRVFLRNGVMVILINIPVHIKRIIRRLPVPKWAKLSLSRQFTDPDTGITDKSTNQEKLQTDSQQLLRPPVLTKDKGNRCHYRVIEGIVPNCKYYQD